MQITITYKGTLNGVQGVWCGYYPKGAEIEEEITVYRADEGKVLVKDEEMETAVILKDGENIDEWEEIDEPEEEEDIDYEQQERLRLDALHLTPSDVERALLKAKNWDFEDLKVFLKEQGYSDLQIKAIGIELRANIFFRGATMGEEPNKIRIVDSIGALLGYSSEDMDYLFEHKELPLV